MMHPWEKRIDKLESVSVYYRPMDRQCRDESKTDHALEKELLADKVVSFLRESVAEGRFNRREKGE